MKASIALRNFLEEPLRRSSLLIIAAVSCLLLGVAAIWLNPRFALALPAQAQSVQPQPAVSAAGPQATQIKPVSATFAAGKTADISSTQFAGAGSEIYTAKRGES